VREREQDNRRTPAYASAVIGKPRHWRVVVPRAPGPARGAHAAARAPPAKMRLSSPSTSVTVPFLRRKADLL